MRETTPTLSLQDIADLAQVRRAVVSMWRKRPMARGRYLPFPEPIETIDGSARFDKQGIVDWLQCTGRGNNTESSLDAPSLATPEGTTLDELVALLCVANSTDHDLAELTAAQRVDVARTIDPDDRFLLSEIASSRPTAELLRFIDDLVEASFGRADALRRLDAGRAARAQGARGTRLNSSVSSPKLARYTSIQKASRWYMPDPTRSLRSRWHRGSRIYASPRAPGTSVTCYVAPCSGASTRTTKLAPDCGC